MSTIKDINNKVKNIFKDHRNIMKTIILFEIIYVFFIDGFTSFIPVVSSFNYALDLLNVVLICGLLIDIKSVFKIKEAWIFIPWLIYAVICFVSAMINSVYFLLLAWAVRNTFRFLVLFLAAIIYISKDDVKKFLKLLVNLQFINIPLVLIQYFYFKTNAENLEGIFNDYIGGICGFELGVNGRLNIYLAIIFVIALIDVFEKDKITWQYIFVSISTMVCASYAEIKFFIIEASLIFVLMTFVYIKKIKFTTFVKAFLIYAGSLTLYVVMSPSYAKTVVNYKKYEEGNVGVYKLSRSNPFPEINKLFFDNSIIKELFGIGFGNAEYSRFSFFTSEFYNQYGFYNYRWFSHQMLYIETGMLGFLSFILIPVVAAVQSYIAFLKNKGNRFISAFTIAVAATIFMNLWYNNSFRSDFAYFTYFCLATFLIFRNHDSLNEDKISL